jgi:hypothetical protein
MRIIYSALVAATVIGSTLALGACAAYDDGYGSSVSVGVGYDDGYYYHHPRHHWRRGYYY